MAYHEGKIISATIGTKVPVPHSVTNAVVVDADIAGDWEGIHRESGESSIDTSRVLPIYFRIENRTFYRHDGSNWVTVPATDARVFGSGNVWLGKVGGATGSTNVETLESAGNWLEDNSYDSTKTYFYYDILDNRIIKITDFTAATDTEDTTLYLVKGNLDKVYINRAVTFAGETDDITNIKVRLAGENEEVIGSIIGLSYGKLQIAAQGWDVKFINGTGNPLTVGKRIIGKANSAVHPTIPKGFIQEVPDAPSSYTQADADIRRKGRGMVVNPGDSGGVGVAIVRVAMVWGD